MKKTAIIVIVLLVVVIIVGLGMWYSLGVNRLPSIQKPINNSLGTTSSTNTSSSVTDLFNIYSITAPDGLLLTDSSGRRTGEDPKTGVTYQEIPNTSYVPQPNEMQLTVNQPLEGQYTIQVIGKHTGQYSLWLGLENGAQGNPVTYTGTIQQGQVITYTQNYDPSNLASSTLVFQVGTSSLQ
jgi:hypothetical protein